MRFEATVRAQAALLSYVETFWLLAIIAILAVPLVLLLLRRVKPGQISAAH